MKVILNATDIDAKRDIPKPIEKSLKEVLIQKGIISEEDLK